MRSLRSRNVDSKSSSSEVDGNTSLTKITKKKLKRNRRSKKSITHDDPDNDITEETIEVLNNTEECNNISQKLKKNKKKKSKKSAARNSDLENSKSSTDVLNLTEHFVNVSESKNLIKKKGKKSLHESGNNLEEKSILNFQNCTINDSDKTNNVNKKRNQKAQTYDHSDNENSEKTIEILKDTNESVYESQNNKSKKKKSKKSFISNENVQNTHTVLKVFNENDKSVDRNEKDVNLDDEAFPTSFFKLDKSSSASSLSKSVTNNIECIEIEDSIIEDGDSKIIDATLGKTNETFSSKTMDETFNKDSSQVVNRSGQWAVQDISNTESETNKTETKYISQDKITLHQKIHLLNETFDSPGKSNRKRWVKLLETGTLNSPLLKIATNSELKSSKPLSSSSPLERKSTAKVLNSTFSTPLKINKTHLKSTGKKNNSMIFLDPVVNNKISSTKCKPMPNFSLIHQKAFDKMESLQDYSERKKERAKQMMSTEKLKLNEESLKENNKKQVVKSSQDLFGGVQTQNKLEIRVSNTPIKEKIPFKSLLQKPKYYKTPQRFKPSVKENIASKLQKPIDLNIFTLSHKNSDKSMIPHPKINSEKPTVSLSKIKPESSLFSYSRINPEKAVFSHSRINPEKSGLSQSRINSEKSILTQLKAVPEKPVPVFSRGHYIAVANKTKVQDKLGNIKNRRDTMKGVRTNRRFDLLMQMRNKK